MDNFTIKKNEYIQHISAWMLNNGIAACSLKKMAAAASTSDRMLMHYFKDKEEIMALALRQISENMLVLLNHESKRQLTFEEMIPLLLGSLKSNQFKPYLNIWFELIHLADENEVFSRISNDIGEAYWQWLGAVYAPLETEDQNAMLTLLFTFVEGLVLMDKMGMTERMDLAAKAFLDMYQQSSLK